MQQHTGPSLPCLDALNAILTPDKDTNFLSNLIPQSSIRASITIDLAKSLYDRLEKQEILFKSSREVDWALEILGYGFIPPHSQFIKDERNHLKNIITIYDFLLSDEAEITVDAGTIKISSRKPPVLNLSDYHHQKICLKMLSHLTLIFDKRNFEKKPNPLVGDPRLREEEMKVPIKLCAMVIRIYDKFLNKAYPFLYPDNWEYIIKLISGLASFILQGSIENKFPERIHVAVVELLYNSWIFSGLQNEQTWLVFKQCIHDIITKDTANSKQNAHELTAKDIIVSYWTDICAELTAKLLIDLKCYEPPKLLLSSKDEKIEYNYNLLIINHNYNLLKTDVQQQKKKFTLFQQPFLFNISQEQVQYLWGKMITMMPDTLGHARTYYLVIQGIRNIVNLLLRLGTLSKPTEEIQESSAYRIENKRIIKIDKSDHEYIYFKKLLNYITSKEKIKPNDKRISTNNSQASKAAPSEEEKLLVSKKKSKNLDNAPSQILKRPQDDQHRLINTEKEYSWVVKTEKVPSGEYLLKLFGRVLFEGAAMTVTGYEDARLLAINILCKIFTKACGPFPEAAVKRFYKVYLDYLESELNLQKLQTFFKHSTELFLVNHLPHNIVLQVPLVNKLVEYYTNHKESGFQDKILRGACNKICSSLLCFFNDENGLINSKYNYVKNVKDILHDLLEVAFQKDKEAIVSHRLASTKSSHEEAKILARSAWNFMIYSIMNCKINGFVSKITEGWFERSFPLLNNLGIDIFLVLGEICLMRDDYQSPSPLTADVASAGFSIIEKIKKFIEHRTKDLNDIIKHSSQKNNEKDEAIKQISSSFGILYTWLLVIIHLKGIENLDQKKEFSPAVEGTIKLLISYQNYEPFAISVKCMLASLLNRLGNASFSSNSPFASSILLNENSKKYATLDEMTDKLDEKCLLSIAIGEDTILSFYDLQLQSTNEAIVFMVRNPIGRFVWFGELFYKLFCPSKKGLEEGLQEAAIKIPAFKEEEKKQRNMSFEIMNPTGATNNQELELLLQQQFEIEDEYEETHTRNSLLRNRDRFASEASLSLLNETEEDKITRSKINTIKMFLSSTGILSIKDLEKITYIPSGGSIRDLLKKIDSSPARCQILSSIFYVLSPSSEKLSEFPRTDKLFQNFIEDLGVTVDEDTIESGAHESIKTYVNQHKKVIFASNPLYEMIFTLPNLLQAQMNLQEFSSIPPIIIVWNAKLVNPNESFYPYIINRLDIKGFKTALIITPLNEGYFSLNILKRDSDFMSFPPIKDFVCSYHMLVTLVPQMVISIHREYQNCHHKLLYHEVITNKIQDRQKHILNLINYSKKEDHQDHQWELLKSFFDISKS